MSDKGMGPLDVIGYTSGLTALGFAAGALYSHGTNMKANSHMFDKAAATSKVRTEAAIKRKAGATMGMTAEEIGMSLSKTPGSRAPLELKELDALLQSKGYGSQHTGLLAELKGIQETAFRNNAHVDFTITEYLLGTTSHHTVDMTYTHKTSHTDVAFRLTKDGLVYRENFGSFAVARDAYMDHFDTQSVIEGHKKKPVLRGYNESQAYYVKRRIAAGETSTIGADMGALEDTLITVSRPDPNSIAVKKIRSAGIAFKYDDKNRRIRRINAVKDKEDLLKFYPNLASIYDKPLEEVTAMMSDRAIGGGEFFVPGSNNPMRNDFGIFSSEFDKVGMQFLGRQTEINESFIKPITEGLKEDKNLTSIHTFMETGGVFDKAKTEHNWIDMMMTNGVIDGVNHPALAGREVTVMSESLAKVQKYDTITHDINVSKSLDASAIEGWRTPLLFDYLDHEKFALEEDVKEYRDIFDLGSKESGKSAKTANLKTISGNKELTDRWQSLREKVWDKAIAPTGVEGGEIKSQMGEYLKAVDGYKPYHALLNPTELGNQRLGEYGRKSKITNIYSGGVDGYKVVEKVTHDLIDHNKVWGGNKTIAAYLISDKTSEDLARFLFAVNTSDRGDLIDELKVNLLSEKPDIAKAKIQFEDISNSVDWAGSETKKQIVRGDGKVFFSGSTQAIKKNNTTQSALAIRETIMRLDPNVKEADFGKTAKSIIDYGETFYDKNKSNPDVKYALGSLFDGTESTRGSAMRLLTGTEVSGELSGFKIGKDVRISMDVANRYKHLGLSSAHDMMVDNINVHEFDQFVSHYAPVFSKDIPKNSIILEAVSLDGHPDEIRNIFAGGDISRKTAANVAERTGVNMEKIDKTTSFFVKTKDDSLVPVPTAEFTTNFGTVDKLTGNAQPGESIQGAMSQASESYINASNRGSESLPFFKERFENTTKSIMFSNDAFVKPQVSGAQLQHRNAVISDTLIADMKKTNPGNIEAIDNVLKKYDISEKALKEHNLGFVGEKDFYELARMDDRYKGIAQKNKLDFFNSKKNGLYAYTIRHPEGISATRILRGEKMYTELLMATGHEKKEARKLSASHFQRGGISFTARGVLEHQADYDSDQIILILAKDEKGRAEILSFIEESNEVFNKISKSSAKGIKVSSSSHASMKAIRGAIQTTSERASTSLKGAVAFGGGIGEISNTMRDTAGGLENMNREAIYMASVLREGSIQSKGLLGQDIKHIETFKQAFNTNLDMPERVSKLKEVVFNTPAFNYTHEETGESVNYFAKHSDEFFSGFLKGHSDYEKTTEGMLSSLMRDVNSGSHVSNERIADVFKNVVEHGDSGEILSGIFSRALSKDTGKVSSTRRFVQNMSEGGFSKIAKSTGFRIAGGIALAAVLLKPSDNAIKHQEVREESHPRANIPAPQDAINPPVGNVYQSGAQGYHLSVRGRTPRSTNSGAIQSTLNNMGVPMGGSVVNRSNGVDSQYMEQLQYDNDTLKWNAGS